MDQCVQTALRNLTHGIRTSLTILIQILDLQSKVENEQAHPSHIISLNPHNVVPELKNPLRTVHQLVVLDEQS